MDLEDDGLVYCSGVSNAERGEDREERGMCALVTPETEAEVAQSISANSPRDPVGLKGGAEVAEVSPGWYRRVRSGRRGWSQNNRPRWAIKFAWSGLATFDEQTVILPNLPDLGSAEVALYAGILFYGRHEMGKVNFHRSLDIGASLAGLAKPQHLVAHKLIVGLILKWQKSWDKEVSLWEPCAAVSSDTRTSRPNLWVSQPSRAKLVKRDLARSRR